MGEKQGNYHLNLQCNHQTHNRIRQHNLVPNNIRHKPKQIANHPNTALRIATGCTADTNITHLHQETQTLPLKTHLTLHVNQLKTKATQQQHPLHTLLNQPPPQRKQKETLFLNATYNKYAQTGPNLTIETITETIKTTHTQIVKEHIDSLPHNKINSPFAQIQPSEESLPRQLDAHFHNYEVTNPPSQWPTNIT